MVGKIQVSYSELIKNQKLTLNRLEDAYRHLSSGKSIQRPGDQVVNFEIAGNLMNETLFDKAKLESLQSRISWFQTIEQNLLRVQDVLDDMLRQASQSADPTSSQGDREVYDVNFQQNKEVLSFIIDGESGRKGASASFAGMPLLLGNFVAMDLEGSVAEELEANTTNLFTNYAPDGQSNPSKLESQATFDSQTGVKLPDSASDMANYYVGTTLTVTSGQGDGQTAVIASYDPVTKVATLDRTLDIALKGNAPDQSEFEIDLEGRFASKVWGADNRFNDLDLNEPTVFAALTEAEINYRIENNIPNVDFTIYTEEETLARKKLNIFDSEYGNIASVERGQVMREQVTNAKERIATFTARVSAKLGNLQDQVQLSSSMKKWKDEGVGVLEDVKVAEEMTSVQELTLAHQKILELSLRLSESYGKLNDLIHNKGVR